MTDPFADLMAGISNPAITAANLGFDRVNMIPVDLALPLKDFQLDAVMHAFRNTVTTPYAMTALDMGLGKSPVAWVVAATAAAYDQTPTLIVVPPSLRFNMLREAEKFAPWLSVAVITGKEPGEDDDLGDIEADVLLIGDSSIDGWADHLAGKIAHLVVDESHRFKNKAGRSAAMVKIAGAVPGMRIVMTGTPVPNGRHQELANQVDIMGPDAWGDIGGKGTFWNYYAPKKDRWGGRDSNHGDELFATMSDEWFFRLAKDESDGSEFGLPNKYREALHLEGRGRAVRDYVRAEDDLIAWLQEKNGKVTAGQRRAEALMRMTMLRKLAGECKVAAAIEHVKDLMKGEDTGVFVVAEHKGVMDALMVGLNKYNPVVVQGGMTDNAKGDACDAFNSGEAKVMIGQITAAGVGLNLTGEATHEVQGVTVTGGNINRRVVVVQLPWTPADLKQAEDRLWRIGQQKNVLVEVALCAIEGRWTIDERLWGILEAKNFASTSITDGEGDYLMGAEASGVLESYGG